MLEIDMKNINEMISKEVYLNFDIKVDISKVKNISNEKYELDEVVTYVIDSCLNNWEIISKLSSASSRCDKIALFRSRFTNPVVNKLYVICWYSKNQHESLDILPKYIDIMYAINTFAIYCLSLISSTNIISDSSICPTYSQCSDCSLFIRGVRMNPSDEIKLYINNLREYSNHVFKFLCQTNEYA